MTLFSLFYDKFRAMCIILVCFIAKRKKSHSTLGRRHTPSPSQEGSKTDTPLLRGAGGVLVFPFGVISSIGTTLMISIATMRGVATSLCSIQRVNSVKRSQVIRNMSG